MPKPKFVLKQGSTGFNFNLVAGNNEIIGTSQVYASRVTAKKGIASVQKNAPIAEIEDKTIEAAKLKNPKFELYLDKRGEFRFRLLAANGQNILASEGYKEKASCKNGIASVKKNAPVSETQIAE